MTKVAQEFIQTLENVMNPISGAAHAKFFKAFPGGYGEGDVFWGISVPVQRSIGKQFYRVLSFDDIRQLLHHSVHEIRLSTLMLMVLRFQKCPLDRETLVQIYLENLEHINNWDLVDCSAAYILGPWFLDKSHAPLFELANSNNIWRQRIAVLTSFHFIKMGSFDTTFQLSELMLHHKHDLIHKAIGWMLREIGNRNYEMEYTFLCKHYRTMPRTMLRYAIEKFDENIRQDFLKGRI